MAKRSGVDIVIDKLKAQIAQLQATIDLLEGAKGATEKPARVRRAKAAKAEPSL